MKITLEFSSIKDLLETAPKFMDLLQGEGTAQNGYWRGCENGKYQNKQTGN